MPAHHIAEGAAADITLFDPALVWTHERAGAVSRGDNSPFFGWKLHGRPMGIIRGHAHRWNTVLREATA